MPDRPVASKKRTALSNSALIVVLKLAHPAWGVLPTPDPTSVDVCSRAKACFTFYNFRYRTVTIEVTAKKGVSGLSVKTQNDEFRITCLLEVSGGTNPVALHPENFSTSIYFSDTVI